MLPLCHPRTHACHVQQSEDDGMMELNWHGETERPKNRGCLVHPVAQCRHSSLGFGLVVFGEGKEKAV